MVALVECDRDTVRLHRHLRHGVADATIVTLAILGCDDKESVLNVEKRITHKRLNFKYYTLCACLSQHKDSHEFANKNIFTR